MSPRAFDPAVVQVRLRHLAALLDDFADLGPYDPETLATDGHRRYTAERILTQLVEVAVGINGHIGAALLGKVGAGYAATFDLAVEAGALSAETARRIRPSVGTRNVLVHEYLTIDYARVAEAALRAPVDYGDYIREVAAFLLRREEELG